MKFHVMGNSHVYYFLGECKNEDNTEYSLTCDSNEYFVTKLGSTGATIFGLSNKNSRTGAGNRIKDKVASKEVENLILFLGEVDCREHVQKHAKLNATTIKHEVSKVITEYEKFISSSVTNNVKTLSLISTVPYTEAVTSSLDYKIETSIEFNLQLQLLCKQNGYFFVDFYNSIVEKDGFLKDSFLHSGVHIKYDLAKKYIHDCVSSCGVVNG